MAAGGEEGLRVLCCDFYHIMDTQEFAQTIRRMHKESLDIMIDKLTLFLCMWLGGPRTYIEKYDFVPMPKAHQHFVINEAERDAWLRCMDLALDQQNYEEEFKDYLKRQFRFPANMIMAHAKK